MSEPTGVAIAGVAAGGLATAAAIGDWLGIDASALLWGAAGGLAMLSVQPPMPRMRALIAVAVAALLAGAVTELLTHWAVQALPRAPEKGLAHGVSFLLGLASQRLLPAVLEAVPAVRDALLARVRGRAEDDKPQRPSDSTGGANG